MLNLRVFWIHLAQVIGKDHAIAGGARVRLACSLARRDAGARASELRGKQIVRLQERTPYRYTDAIAGSTKRYGAHDLAVRSRLRI